MRYTFQSPASETAALHNAFVSEIIQKITPKWIYTAMFIGTSVFAGFAAYKVAEDVKQLILLTILSLLCLSIYPLLQIIHQKILAKYLDNIPNISTWVVEIDESTYSTKNRGAIISFPLTAISRIYEKQSALYIDFSDLGRTRIPFPAFQSDNERRQLIQFLESRKAPSS